MQMKKTTQISSAPFKPFYMLKGPHRMYPRVFSVQLIRANQHLEEWIWFALNCDAWAWYALCLHAICVFGVCVAVQNGTKSYLHKISLCHSCINNGTVSVRRIRAGDFVNCSYSLCASSAVLLYCKDVWIL